MSFIAGFLLYTFRSAYASESLTGSSGDSATAFTATNYDAVTATITSSASTTRAKIAHAYLSNIVTFLSAIMF